MPRVRASWGVEEKYAGERVALKEDGARMEGEAARDASVLCALALVC